MSQKEDLSMKPEDVPFAGDALGGPTIYIDGMQGAMNLAGNFTINLYHHAQDFTDLENPKVVRVIAGRLVLSAATLVGVHQWMGGMVADIQSGGKAPDGDQ